MSEISIFSEENIPPTICRHCVFAKWQGDEQVGCKLDRIDKLEENGAEIVGIDEDGVKYFAILKRFCNACRTEDSFKDVAKKHYAGKVYSEIRPRIDYIIRGETSSLGEIMNTAQSILKQLPKSLTVIVGEGIKSADILSKFFKNKFPIYVIKSYSDKSRPVDEAFKKFKGQFYCEVDGGFVLEDDFAQKIHDYLNKEMKRFILIEDDNFRVYISMLHKNLMGNRDYSLAQKIKEWADEEGVTNLIKTWEDFS